MKKLYNFLLILSLPLVLVLFSYHSGSPGGKTGSTGDMGNNCTDCHAGTAQSATDWISSDIPAIGFMPGETYTITATGTHTGVVRFGFELTAEDETGEKVGTFSISDATRTQLANANSSVTHTADGITPNGDSNSWTVSWTAPDPAPETVLFNAAFNAANGNGNNNGDIIYTTEMLVSQQHVGLPDNALADQTNIYPNPATDNLAIVAPINSAITIMDISGRLVNTIVAQSESTSINVSSYKSGLYFVNFEYQGNFMTHKLIVK